MPIALINGRVLLPDGLHNDCCVVMEGDRISAVSTGPPEGADIVDLAGDLLLPGFIDVQVNGGGDRLFNDDPSVETIGVIAAAHRRFGTTGLLPTVISDDLEITARAIAAVDNAIDQAVPGVLGIHIEGPFISTERRGIHLASKLRPLDNRCVELLCSARNGRTLVTVAPECVSAEQIQRLVQSGVIVSAGHSDADYETASRAIDAGMTGFTHLFNAMSQLTGRAPGMVGAALDHRSCFAGLIADGHHVHPASLRIAIAAKGTDRVMLVTDAMGIVGGESDEFILQGRSIRRDGDRLVSEDGVLAGSTLTMCGAVANAVRLAQVDLADAVRMATSSPAQFLGLSGETGAIVPGLRADLVRANDDLSVVDTWIAGRAPA